MRAQEDSSFCPATAGWEPYGEGFAGLVGPLWHRHDAAGTRYGFLAGERHLNPVGNVHGGMLTTFIDDALSLAAREKSGGIGQATIQLNVHFIAAVKSGDFVEARCEVVRQARSLMFMRVNCHVGERIVASADGIWKLFPPQHDLDRV